MKGKKAPKMKGMKQWVFAKPRLKKKKKKTNNFFSKKKKRLPLFMRLEWYSDHFKERPICSPFKRAKATQLLITLVLRIIWCK